MKSEVKRNPQRRSATALLQPINGGTVGELGKYYIDKQIQRRGVGQGLYTHGVINIPLA